MKPWPIVVRTTGVSCTAIMPPPAIEVWRVWAVTTTSSSVAFSGVVVGAACAARDPVARAAPLAGGELLV
jgi:hypothetical protein